MIETIKDGGPAFPIVTDRYVHEYGRGMTLRDWFAGRVLNGMLAHSTRYKPAAGYSKTWHDAISEESYDIADAMLAAREATK